MVGAVKSCDAILAQWHFQTVLTRAAIAITVSNLRTKWIYNLSTVSDRHGNGRECDLRILSEAKRLWGPYIGPELKLHEQC